MYKTIIVIIAILASSLFGSATAQNKDSIRTATESGSIGKGKKEVIKAQSTEEGPIYIISDGGRAADQKFKLDSMKIAKDILVEANQTRLNLSKEETKRVQEKRMRKDDRVWRRQTRKDARLTRHFRRKHQGSSESSEALLSLARMTEEAEENPKMFIERAIKNPKKGMERIAEMHVLVDVIKTMDWDDLDNVHTSISKVKHEQAKFKHVLGFVPTPFLSGYRKRYNQVWPLLSAQWGKVRLSEPWLDGTHKMPDYWSHYLYGDTKM